MPLEQLCIFCNNIGPHGNKSTIPADTPLFKDLQRENFETEQTNCTNLHIINE